jgi:hypothetical protein
MLGAEYMSALTLWEERGWVVLCVCVMCVYYVYVCVCEGVCEFL